MNKMTMEEFQKWCKEHNDNQFNDDGLGEYLGNISQEFGLFCRKCNSKKVQVIGESGVDYGGMTGYSPASNVIKCNDCGNAVTLWI
jgi:Zn finger protein HypA/HybF involved in hydrogenase expression